MIRRIVFYYLLLLPLIVGVTWGSFSIWHSWQQESEPEIWKAYAGRLYLPAEEYEQFKQFLADNPDVEIDKLDVWASPKNALVEVKLTAPANIDVPYGEVTSEYDHSPSEISLYIIGQALLLFFSLGLYLLIRWFTIFPGWFF